MLFFHSHPLEFMRVEHLRGYIGGYKEWTTTLTAMMMMLRTATTNNPIHNICNGRESAIHHRAASSAVAMCTFESGCWGGKQIIDDDLRHIFCHFFAAHSFSCCCKFISSSFFFGWTNIMYRVSTVGGEWKRNFPPSLCGNLVNVYLVHPASECRRINLLMEKLSEKFLLWRLFHSSVFFQRWFFCSLSHFVFSLNY